ncbi:MAG TPA: C10 family peptidase, partial [Candidatus Acidoferrales bacterium]|nr:C10 family peptidase [Candidatus Acidoferrales bacterium]
MAPTGLLSLTFFLLAAGMGLAVPVTPATAARAVQGWLRQDRGLLTARLPGRIRRTDPVKDAVGAVQYYIVRMEPVGYVIVSADDSAEPIVAFSPTGNFDSASASPVAALVNRDLPRRLARARAKPAAKNRAKWNLFLAGSDNPPPDLEENGSIVAASQIWVAPLVQTLWSQTVDVGLSDACYNYFTPPGPNGDTSNYPCGCVATAMAQVMYYFQYPTGSVGTASFPITVNGVTNNVALFGGPYQWTNMPLSPNGPTA